MEDLGKKPFTREALENWYRLFNKFKQKVNCNTDDNEFIDEELAQWVSIQKNMKNRLPAELKDQLSSINFDFDEKEVSWEHRFRQLTKFANKNGHSWLPSNDPKYEALRDWLLRQILDKKFLSESQFKKLDSLAVNWEIPISRDHRWELMYITLKKFHKEFGHCRVPQNWSRDKKLANWVVVQRRGFATGKMKKDRLQKLNALEFTWHIKAVFDQNWEQFYQQLVTFRNEYGHCKVPGKFTKLASWIDRQRTLRKKKLMDAERESRLNEIDFIWDFKIINESYWNDKYKKLTAYKKQHGNSFVPVNYKEDRSLGQWVALQRRLEAKGKLEKKKKEKLNNLDFVWSKDTERKMREVYDAQWHSKFEKLKAYKEKYGTCQVSLKIDRALQRWTRWQRILYDQGKLEEKRFDKLNAIEFPWSVNHGYWMKMFKALTQFHKEHGHLKVPFQWESNPRLAAWIYRVRKNKHELTERQINLLNGIGFDWTLNQRKMVSWSEMYKRLLIFKRDYGHTRVPVKWAKDPKLGKWVSRMRYKREDLYEERLLLLNAINFDWGYRLVTASSDDQASSIKKF